MLEPITKKDRPRLFEVFDIETTTDLTKVYLVGWYDGIDYKFWESEPLPPEDSQSAMTQYLRWAFTRRNERNIYGHNAGNFDTVFALKSIMVNFPHLQASIIPSNSTILILEVTDPSDGHVWRFLDSMRTLPDSLNNLGLCFVGKGKVDIKCDYETLMKNPLRYEYLKRDCTLLFDVLEKAFERIRNRLNGRVSISAASTALATYRAAYQDIALPPGGEKSDRLARAGYYGGRCEVFRKHFEGSMARQLNYFDVNSMYPDAMRKPMPFTVSKKETDCGFLDCTVSVPEQHIPVLPFRAKGKLLFPIGRFRGTFSTVELELAQKHGAKIEKVHEKIYYKTRILFGDFVDKLYWLRNKDNPNFEEATAKIAKLILNSLYGKFGSSVQREQIHVRPTIRDIASRHMVPMLSPITNDCYIEKTEIDADYLLPHIAAWVTSLSRCKFASGAIEANTECYYGDTDSLLTTITIANIGNGLGQWKSEHARDPVVKGFFLAPKVYVLRHASGKITNRAKGFARFGEKLPEDIVQLLATGQAAEVSRFAKARSVIRGEFGLVKSLKRIHNKDEKRIFDKDGNSRPRKIEQ